MGKALQMICYLSAQQTSVRLKIFCSPRGTDQQESSHILIQKAGSILATRLRLYDLLIGQWTDSICVIFLSVRPLTPLSTKTYQGCRGGYRGYHRCLGRRARRAFDSHLARAKWMTEHGYRQLLRGGVSGLN
jgi:hypothetical protein